MMNEQQSRQVRLSRLLAGVLLAWLLVAGVGASPAQADTPGWTGGSFANQETAQLSVDAVNSLLVYRLGASAPHDAERSEDGGATWQALGNPGETIHALAADPRQATVLYAGGEGHVFRSGDAGRAWQALNSPTLMSSFMGTPLPLEVDLLAPSPVQVGRIFLAGVPKGSVRGPAVLERSDDGGHSWTLLPTPSGTYNFFTSLTPDPASAQRLYAGLGNYMGGADLYRSNDVGQTWTRLAAPGVSIAFRVLDGATLASPDGPLYAFGSNPSSAIARSDDAGASWQSEATPAPVLNLAVDPFAPLHLYAILRPVSGPATLYMADQGGASWGGTGALGGELPSSVQGVNVLVISPSPPFQVYAATNAGIFRYATAPSHGPHYFPETGFSIAVPAFWDYFSHRGGVATFGYPVSRTVTFQSFPVQFFQRHVMQLWPDGSVHLLNLLDPGLLPYTSFNFSTFPGVDSNLVATAPDPTNQPVVLTWVQQHAPNVVAGAPVNFDATFLDTVSAQTAFPNGGDAALLPGIDLEVWGVPTSQPMMDANNHNFIYLRWQRGIMMYDASCSCTQGVLLADYLKAILTGQNLPADLAQEAVNSPFLNQYDPGAPHWVRNASLLPNTDLTDAFTPE